MLYLIQNKELKSFIRIIVKVKGKSMTIKDVNRILDGSIIYGKEHLEKEVHAGCGSDMMSDVLAFSKNQSVLLTGLCNLQVVRTAEMMDIICIVFVRGKKPDESMIALAKELGVVLLTTRHRMFSACGLLYEQGLRGGVCS